MKFPIFLLLLIIGSGFILAAPPELPMIISGDAYINDRPAKIGTEITAKIGEQEITSVKISEMGRYTFLLQKLNDKDNVSFYVDNIYSGKSVTYESGGFEQLTLKVEKSYLIYYLGVALILLITGFLIWKRKLIPKRRKK